MSILLLGFSKCWLRIFLSSVLLSTKEYVLLQLTNSPSIASPPVLLICVDLYFMMIVCFFITFFDLKF